MPMHESGGAASPSLTEQDWEESTGKAPLSLHPAIHPSLPQDFHRPSGFSVQGQPCGSFTQQVANHFPAQRLPPPTTFHVIKEKFTRKLVPHSIKAEALHSNELSVWSCREHLALLGEVHPSQQHSTANALGSERPMPYSPCTTCWTKWGR